MCPRKSMPWTNLLYSGSVAGKERSEDLGGHIDRQTDGGRSLRAEKELVQRRTGRGREDILGNRERAVVVGSPLPFIVLPFIGSPYFAVMT